MQILTAKLQELKEEEEAKKYAAERKGQIGTGDRSEKIRTYNILQDRVTDHRIKQSWHNIEQIFRGDIDLILQALADVLRGKARLDIVLAPLRRLLPNCQAFATIPLRMNSITTPTNETLDALYGAGAHYGVTRSRRHPSSNKYLYTNKDRVDVFDLQMTHTFLEHAKEFARTLGRERKMILFVGGKPGESHNH